FTTKALSELKYAFRTSDNSYVERCAAWELAQWYLNQGTRQAARQSLEYVDVAARKEKDRAFLRRVAILKAEAYAFLQEQKEGMAVLAPFLNENTQADVFLAAANLTTPTKEKVDWINKALALTGIAPITLEKDKSLIPYDCLACEDVANA